MSEQDLSKETTEELSRRAFLGRSLQVAGTAMPLVLLTACKSDDESFFGSTEDNKQNEEDDTSDDANDDTGDNGNDGDSGDNGDQPDSGDGSEQPEPKETDLTLRDTPDENGLYLPEGFSSRIIAESGLLIKGTGFLAPFPMFPDGAYSFADPENDGGWIHVINKEVPAIGGAIAVRFDKDGNISDAYSILNHTNTNCAGGFTPWGSWLSCEEVSSGTSWETHPLGKGTFNGVEYPIRQDYLGIFKHEAGVVDASNKTIYLTEDQSDGCFYRFVADDPQPWDGSVKGDLSKGQLQVAVVRANGALLANTGSLSTNNLPTMTVEWVNVPDYMAGYESWNLDFLTGSLATTLTGLGVYLADAIFDADPPNPTRYQVNEATVFNGGEGCWYHEGKVYFTTKGDNRVWEYVVESRKLSILYDEDFYLDPILTGVDNLIVESHHDHIVVAEDGGNLEAVVITPENKLMPLVRLSPKGHYGSEITGLAFNPQRTRFYFNSQRGSSSGPLLAEMSVFIPKDVQDQMDEKMLNQMPGNGGGITYEIYRDDGLPIFGS
ncbi:alkaline phosphatase PhoX [Thiomicrorhabdus sp.]|uniref:alkaline phosphatase PhoX n=1 Tax=Thiomicrorhabdus sp. TaxID=2039724 RepID=UPI0029C7E305|nr:alkaline phosphatase PhoX [Thiomicrorhabdus sp.]